MGQHHATRVAGLAMMAIGAFSTLPPQPAYAADPVEVGLAVALTGALAALDAEYINGIKLAVKQMNDADGVDGHQLNLHILDNNTSATVGVTVTNQLLNQYNASVMLDSSYSPQTVAIHPIVAKAKVPVITISQVTPDLNWAFGVSPALATVVEQQLQYVKQTLHATKIAYIATQAPSGQAATAFVKIRAPQLGIDIVYVGGVDSASIDLTPQMAGSKDAKPDVILDFMTGPVHIVEAKAAATVGLQVPIVMGLEDIPTFKKAASAYSNVYLTAVPSETYPNIPDPGSKAATGKFLEAYKAAGLDPSGVAAAAWGWDAANILALAIKASGATGGEKLRAAIENVDYPGVLTHFKFSASDHTGQLNVPNPLQIVKLDGDALKVVFPVR